MPLQPQPTDRDVSFRPLAATDLPTVAGWLAQPHVRRWWRDPAEPAAVEAKYLPRIAGDEPTEVFVLRVGDRDVGIIQGYRLGDHGGWARTISGSGLSFPNGAGIDYFIGEPDAIGGGIGSRAIAAFSSELFSRYPDIDCIVVTPQAANRASCRALENAGYDLRWTGRLDSDDPSDAGTAALYVLHNTSDDAELLAEQRRFYDADAESFDEWLGTLLDEENDDPAALRYRAGRALVDEVVGRSLGHVLEIAAGTGRLAELYAPRATSVVLLDASRTSLTIAARRLAHASTVRFVEADIFDWDADGEQFDTIVFSAWLHHVPHARFDAFWRTVAALLADSGRVIFDFPDVRVTPPGEHDVPDEPTEGYGFYAPVDGISIRDHFGQRWRVVHNLWDPTELGARLEDLGWAMTVLGPGMFNNIVWASARPRSSARAQGR